MSDRTIDRRPLVVLALDALLDSGLRPYRGARWVLDGLRALEVPLIVVGDVSAATRRVLAGGQAEREIAHAVEMLAAVAEDFNVGVVPWWYLSASPGSLPRSEDVTIAHVRDLWQLNLGMRDVWVTQPVVTASPVFGVSPCALAAYAQAQYCFITNSDPAASIIVSETDQWSRTGFQWLAAAGLRGGPEARSWTVLQSFIQRAA